MRRRWFLRAKNLKISNTRGDTIVEVLLAMAVVSAAIGGAFVSVNRSLQGTTASHERGEALKLLEGQVEQLKHLAAEPSWSAPTGSFCLEGATQAPSCSFGPSGRYDLEITNLPGRTYHLRATWDRVGGGEQQILEIFYRTES